MADFNDLNTLYEHIEATVLTDENFYQTSAVSIVT